MDIMLQCHRCAISQRGIGSDIVAVVKQTGLSRMISISVGNTVLLSGYEHQKFGGY